MAQDDPGPLKTASRVTRWREKFCYDLLPESRSEHMSGHYLLCCEVGVPFHHSICGIFFPVSHFWLSQ